MSFGTARTAEKRKEGKKAKKTGRKVRGKVFWVSDRENRRETKGNAEKRNMGAVTEGYEAVTKRFPAGF